MLAFFLPCDALCALFSVQTCARIQGGASMGLDRKIFGTRIFISMYTIGDRGISGREIINTRKKSRRHEKLWGKPKVT